MKLHTAPFLLISAMSAFTASGCAVESDDAADDDASAVAGSPVSLSLDACVAAHVRRHGGNPLRVTKLDCSIPVEHCEGTTPAPDAAVLAPLANLRSLDLTGRCVVDARPIGALVKLEKLKLAGNAVRDIRPLGALTRLVSLSLADNPIDDTWGFRTREPFSSFARLEELDLDRTGISNIIPLGALPSLRHLSLRDAWLHSVRSLLGLTKLRTLHLDGAGIEDLAPLAGMRELQELTLNDNSIGDVEPLRALAASGGSGRLRKVSLRGNCAASCDAVAGITHDCSDQRATCEHPEQYAPGSALSVPVALVEQYAPKTFPVWTRAELTRAFELVRAASDIDWTYARGNCDGRAIVAAGHLKAGGFPTFTKVLSYGNLRPLSQNDVSGFVAFDWHIAVAVRAEREAGGDGFFVLDPALDATRPLPLADWYARQVDSRGSALNFSCVDYMRVEYPDPELHCTDNPGVDASGALRVDPLRDIRGAVCLSEMCFPR